MRTEFHLNISLNHNKRFRFRELVDNCRFVKMREVEVGSLIDCFGLFLIGILSQEARNDGLPAVAHILRPSLLRHYDANASRSLLSPSMDFRRLPLSSVSICVLQQRLRVDAVNDSHDNQQIGSNTVPAPLPEDLSEEIHFPSTLHGLVHLIPHYGEFSER